MGRRAARCRAQRGRQRATGRCRSRISALARAAVRGQRRARAAAGSEAHVKMGLERRAEGNLLAWGPWANGAASEPPPTVAESSSVSQSGNGVEGVWNARPSRPVRRQGLG